MQVKLSSLIRKLKLAIAKMWPRVQTSYPWYPVSVTLQSWLSLSKKLCWTWFAETFSKAKMQVKAFSADKKLSVEIQEKSKLE